MQHAGGSRPQPGDSAPSATRPQEAAAQQQRQQQAALPTVLGPLEAAVARRQPTRRRSSGASAAGRGAEDGEGPGPPKRARLPEGGKAPGGLSIAPLVRQGLRSKDSSSIERVLQTADHKVIDSTVAELSGAEAFDLLQECTQRLLSQPIRGQVLSTWVQRVLLRHCAFLFSQPALHRGLQPLHDAFQARCGSYRKLVKLRGRLQMLKHSGHAVLEKSKRATATEAAASAPLLEYAEGDEDDAAGDEAGEDASSDSRRNGSGDEDDDNCEDSDDDILLEDSD